MTSSPTQNKRHTVARWLITIVLSLLLCLLVAGTWLFNTLILSQLDHWRPQFVSRLSQAFNMPVSMSAISGRWDGARLRIQAQDVTLGTEHRINIPQLAVTVDWSSVWHRQLRAHLITLTQPQLLIERLTPDSLRIAGININLSNHSSSASFSLAPLFQQKNIVIHQADITWLDQVRHAPPLQTKNLDVVLNNTSTRHNLSLSLSPPHTLANHVAFRAEIQGTPSPNPLLWRGRTYTEINQLTPSQSYPWLDLPIHIKSGQGSLALWANFDTGRIYEMTADLSLHNLNTQLRSDLPPLIIDDLSGRFHAHQIGQKYELGIQQFHYRSGHDVFREVSLDANWLIPQHKNSHIFELPEQAEVRGHSLQLAALARLAERFPLPAAVHNLLRDFQPSGTINQIDFQWTASPQKSPQFKMTGQFEHLAIQAARNFPSIDNLSGEIQGTQTNGHVKLKGDHVHWSWPYVFANKQFPESHVQLDAQWSKQDQQPLSFIVNKLDIHNADAQTSWQAKWIQDSPRGTLDLHGQLTQGRISAIQHYLPKILPVTIHNWFKNALLGGTITHANVIIKGPLDKLPFKTPEDGLFKVDILTQDGQLRFAPEWPTIEHIAARILFNLTKLSMTGTASTLNTSFSANSIDIPDLTAPAPQLSIQAHAQTDAKNLLAYIKQSPLSSLTRHALDTLQGNGNTHLKLALNIPLKHLENTHVDGELKMNGVNINTTPNILPLEAITGTLLFTEHTLKLRDISARLFSSPITLQADLNRVQDLKIKTQGRLVIADLAQWLHRDLSAVATGYLDWQAQLDSHDNTYSVKIDSDTTGLSVQLPAPFQKEPQTPRPLHLLYQARPLSHERRTTLRWGDQAHPILHTDIAISSPEKIRVAMGLGIPAPALPNTGTRLTIAHPHIDLAPWLKLLAATQQTQIVKPIVAVTSTTTLSPFEPIQFSLKTPQLHYNTITLHDTNITGIFNSNTPLTLALKATELQGQLSFNPTSKDPELNINLHRLNIPLSWLPPKNQPAQASLPLSDTPQKTALNLSLIPHTSGHIDSLIFNDKSIGTLDWKSHTYNKNALSIAPITLKNKHLQANSTVLLHNNNMDQFQINAQVDQLQSDNLGELLTFWQLPNVIRNGKANLHGYLQWYRQTEKPALFALSGSGNLNIQTGQLAQFDPGAGKLLNVLSLQALRRRLSLDFNDVFDKGFAFESIAGRLTQKEGLLESNNLQMTSPLATVNMTGNVNVIKETIDLRASVTPSLEEGISVTTLLLGHPLLALVPIAAKVLFKDPLKQLLSFEYTITGPLDKPDVTHESARINPHAVPKKP